MPKMKTREITHDSGKMVYYENGNLFTGTKTIGGITYRFGFYFNSARKLN